MRSISLFFRVGIVFLSGSPSTFYGRKLKGPACVIGCTFFVELWLVMVVFNRGHRLGFRGAGYILKKGLKSS